MSSAAQFLKSFTAVSIPFLSTYAYITYDCRPFSTYNDPEQYHADHRTILPTTPRSNPGKEFRSTRDESLSASLMRSFTLSAITGLCRAYLSTCDVNIEGLETFHTILQQSREPLPSSTTASSTFTTAFQGRPVLTVCNHMSTIDDPIILSRLAPVSAYTNHPERHRWGGCSEEICFKHPLLASFMGSGKVLPIWRGGGLKQEMFEELAAHVVPGAWVHLFPEGCIGQRHLNRSDVPERRRTYMRWGVGKMIAKAKVRPVIVPFYHDGMEQALPLHAETGATVRFIPKTGVTINVVFGTPIEVEDLMEAFVKAHGREELDLPWNHDDSDHVLKLYSKIALRVQEKMQELDHRPEWDVIYPVEGEGDAYLK